MASVTLEGVTKRYANGVVAIDRVSLNVEDHELLVLLGPSGSGKTTLLRLIAGLEEATEGRILLDRQPVNGVPPRRRRLAMVAERHGLYPHLSVRDNLAFGLRARASGGWLRRRVRGRRRRDRERQRRQALDSRVWRIAGTLRIQHLLDRRPGELSAGERQRVALGRALVRRPAAYLFDEPLSHLDEPLRRQMKWEIKQLHGRDQRTLVYVTHDQAEAAALADRVVVLAEGVVQQVGTPAEVYDRPANRFVASFVGRPPMNLIDGELVADGRGPDGPRLRFVCGGWSAAVDSGRSDLLQQYLGKGITCGIRPERMRLGAGGGEEGVVSAVAAIVGVEPDADSTLVALAVGGRAGVSRTGISGDLERIVMCRVGSDFEGKTGDEATVGFRLADACWFDADGAALPDTFN